MVKPTMEAPLLLGRSAKTDEIPAAAEAKRLFRLAGPMVTSFILQKVVQVVSVMFVGHLGDLPLAGASLATSLTNVTGFSLLSGMASALDTMCGQAYGARQFHLLGVYKQRAMLVLSLACIPIALSWANAERILLYIGQDRAIAAEAGAYARWLIPSLIVQGLLECHVRFLQTQSIVLPVTASSGVMAVAHVLVCWLLVHKAGLGSKGAALSNAITGGANLVVLGLYVRLSSACSKSWTGFSMDAFKELRRFVELAVPSAMMISLEWWSFELLLLLSGLMENPVMETSVLSICLNTGALMFMVALGLSSAISTRVSNELGAGQPQAAKLAVRVVVYMALFEGVVLGTTMIVLRNVWGYCYSNQEEIVTYIAKMVPILAISFVVDGLHSSLSGVLTGCGKQKIGAYINLSAYYFMGIPMAVWLAFGLHLNGMGLWLGNVCGSLAKLLLLIFITKYTDWEKEADMAKERVLSSSLPVASEPDAVSIIQQ